MQPIIASPVKNHCDWGHKANDKQGKASSRGPPQDAVGGSSARLLFFTGKCAVSGVESKVVDERGVIYGPTGVVVRRAWLHRARQAPWLGVAVAGRPVSAQGAALRDRRIGPVGHHAAILRESLDGPKSVT